MVYKITAVFSDTESAQSAARRIRASAEDVFAIKMSYITRHGETGSFNRIFYTNPKASVIPANGINEWSMAETVSEELPTDSTRNPSFEYGETCSLTVLTSAASMEALRSIIHNSNGYDMRVTSRPDAN